MSEKTTSSAWVPEDGDEPEVPETSSAGAGNSLPPDRIEAENICPEIPMPERLKAIWRAIREARGMSDSKEEKMRLLLEWNLLNKPAVTEHTLRSMLAFADSHWDNIFVPEQ